MEIPSTDTPILYMTLGLPGAGKTYFAKQYAAKQGVPLIDVEWLRYDLFEDPRYDTSEDKVLANLTDYMAEQFLSAGLSVVVDGLNSTRVRRHDLRKMARKYKVAPLVIWVQTDTNTAFERAHNRDRRNPYDKYAREFGDDEFERESMRTKQPQHEDYVVISGKHLFRNQMNAVLRRLATVVVSEKKPKSVSLGGRVDLNRRRPRPRI